MLKYQKRSHKRVFYWTGCAGAEGEPRAGGQRGPAGQRPPPARRTAAPGQGRVLATHAGISLALSLQLPSLTWLPEPFVGFMPSHLQNAATVCSLAHYLWSLWSCPLQLLEEKKKSFKASLLLLSCIWLQPWAIMPQSSHFHTVNSKATILASRLMSQQVAGKQCFTYPTNLTIN